MLKNGRVSLVYPFGKTVHSRQSTVDSLPTYCLFFLCFAMQLPSHQRMLNSSPRGTDTCLDVCHLCVDLASISAPGYPSTKKQRLWILRNKTKARHRFPSANGGGPEGRLPSHSGETLERHNYNNAVYKIHLQKTLPDYQVTASFLV